LLRKKNQELSALISNSNDILIPTMAYWLSFCGYLNYISYNQNSFFMNYEYSETPLSRSVLAGLATGITATVLNLIYNFIFRGITKLSLEMSVINVSTIIFATVILCLIGGLVYYFIVVNLRKNSNIFIGLFIVLTVIGVVLGLNYHISNDQQISAQFDGLYIGMVIITGVCTAFFIPWLTRHKNVFFN